MGRDETGRLRDDATVVLVPEETVSYSEGVFASTKLHKSLPPEPPYRVCISQGSKSRSPVFDPAKS